MPQEVYRALETARETPNLTNLRAALARVDAAAQRCEETEPDPVACEEAFSLAANLSGQVYAERAIVDRRYARAIAIAERKYGDIHEIPVQLHRRYGLYLAQIGEADEAEDRLLLVLQRSQEMGLRDVLVARGDLAAVLNALGRSEDAEAYLAPALEAVAEGDWRWNPIAISLKTTAAAIAAMQGQHDEAASIYAETCVAMYRMLGDNGGVATCSLNWGMSLIETGDLERAEAVLIIATRAHDRLFGPTHTNALLARAQAAQVLSLRGKTAAAEALFARNRSQLADDPSATPAEFRTRLLMLDAQNLLRARRSLPLARQLLIHAQQSALDALVQIGDFDALAQRSLDGARPAFLLHVKTSWELAKR